MIVLIRKFDHPAGAGIAETIFHEIPGREDKLHKFERFLIRITGKNRLASLHRSWEKRCRLMMKDWMDPERGDRWLRMELVEGKVGRCPDRVLSEDNYWYSREGKEIGEAGSSADEDESDGDDEEHSEEGDDLEDENDIAYKGYFDDEDLEDDDSNSLGFDADSESDSSLDE